MVILFYEFILEPLLSLECAVKDGHEFNVRLQWWTEKLFWNYAVVD